MHLSFVLCHFGKGHGRGSHPEVFYEKVNLKIFAKFTEKHLCQRCFPVNFAKFLRIHFCYRTPSGCFYRMKMFSGYVNLVSATRT